MTIDLSQFHQVFFEESLEGLEAMESSLMELDPENVDSEVINTIFRSAHSIKGGSATFDFKAMCEFTHVLEMLLDQVRSGKRDLTVEHVDLLLQSVDCLREMLVLAQENNLEKPALAAQMQQKFEAVLASDQSNTLPEQNKQENTEDVTPPGKWHVRFKPHPNMLQTGNDALRILSVLKELNSGEGFSVSADISALPSFENIDPELCYLSWQVTLDENIEEDAIKEVFEWVEDEADIIITKDAEEQKQSEQGALLEVQSNTPQKSQVQATTPAATENAAPRTAKTADATFIRVSIDKIDELINLVGELVITQSMLSQLSEMVDTSKLPRLADGIGHLEQNTRELQESVMRIRMLPISFSFNRFPRLVRDLSQKLNKKIQLQINGENTELDKTVMEKIGDPLVHLVRNAIDHGIELPETRIQAGKPETGTITLDAFHQGGHILIQITDDGAGLNKDKVTAKAIEKKIVSQAQVLSMSDEQIYDLIFQPGFSTASQVTDVSGRGVGMDVVKRNIQALSGTVEVQSELGKGSTITIRLPLTLAILDGQLIRVGANIYIFPLVSIVESMQCDIQNVSALAGGQRVFKLREEYVPIIELSKIFNVQADNVEIDGSLIVVVESGGQKIGVIVDELLAQQQVVIKSLEQNYKQVMGVSGATILGDGMVALILDVQSIVALFTQQQLASQQINGSFLSSLYQGAAPRSLN